MDLRGSIQKLYGEKADELKSFPPPRADASGLSPQSRILQRLPQLERLIQDLVELPRTSTSPTGGKKIFIGHGRSHLWLRLKEFLSARLALPCEEFNSDPAQGIHTTDRLEVMLQQAGMAFLVMTAEEKHADGTLHARPNVIHEVGLFQARIGPRRAIVMIEDGCSSFSNLSGLTTIRFPVGDIDARFEDVRRVLEREGFA